MIPARFRTQRGQNRAAASQKKMYSSKRNTYILCSLLDARGFFDDGVRLSGNAVFEQLQLFLESALKPPPNNKWATRKHEGGGGRAWSRTFYRRQKRTKYKKHIHESAAYEYYVANTQNKRHQHEHQGQKTKKNCNIGRIN